LLLALGFVPVRLGTGGDGTLVTTGSAYISSKNCVFTRQIVGEFAKGLGYTKLIDYIALDSTCFQMFRVGEVIDYYFGVKPVFLGVPRNFALPEARPYFYGEIDEFAGKLEAIAGQSLDPAKLAESTELLAGIRESVLALYEIQSRADAPISWREVYEVVQAGFALDRRRYADLLADLLREAKSSKGETDEGATRIIVSGSGLPPGDRKLVDIIDGLGARIVGDDLWTGYAAFVGLKVQGPGLHAIADAYLDRLPHASLPYLDLASDRRLAHLRSLIEATGAQGVIYHTLRYCDAFTFKANETKAVLADDGIPLLEIHTEYASSDVEAMRTRAEAFIEMLENERRQEAAI
jgi:benzoyl-CoA reductase/2-hydroxyglutaryl-CoA dehydratase subunit BcrC/BadD/HgdB